MSQILNPLTFPLHGTRLIEASAGTGKTYTIAALYLRLILQHGGDAAFSQPLAPQSILVVTFTKAATEELRDRIRRRLGEAAQVFRGLGLSDTDPLLLELRDSFPEEQWPALAHRLELAASSMDEAAVYTIHSWAQRMLSQHAFDSGSRFNLKLEDEDLELYREAARDYWRTFVYPLNEKSLELMARGSQPSKRYPKSPDELAKALGKWKATTASEHSDSDLFNELNNLGEELQRIEKEAQAAWQQQQDDIESWFEHAISEEWLYKNYDHDSTRILLQELRSWANGRGSFDPEKHKKLSATGLKLKKDGKTQRKPPDFSALRFLDDLKECFSAVENLRLRYYEHAYRWCSERVESVKQRCSLLCFDDLLNRLNEALHRPNGTALASLIRQQYPVALIDEFQDTDPVQYRMFRKIYLNQPDVGLFMIGDPKQAIYAFRGADIYTYLQARTDAAGELFTLDTNFRSVEPLVGAVNGLFEFANRHEEGAFLFKDKIPFLPVRAKGRAGFLQINGSPAPAMTVWHDVTPRNKETYLKDAAAATASYIVDLLLLAQDGKAGFQTVEGTRALRAADIAVLVRGIDEANAIRSALSERALRSAYLSDRESIYGSQEAGDLLLWLRAVARPESDVNVRVALATPTFRLPLSELDASADTSCWEQHIERFLEYRRLWQQKGVLVMLSRLLSDNAVPLRLLQMDNGGERSLTNILQLGELLQQASASLDGEQALIRYLAERIEEAKESRSEEYVQRLESDDELIKVLTIHKSKGLEYPLVFLPFIGNSKPVDRKGRLFFSYHDESGRNHFDYELTDPALEMADRERLAEDLRLLYVAVTRARHACWLGVTPFTPQSSKLHKSAIGHVLSTGNQIAPDGLAACLEALAGSCDHISIASFPMAKAVQIKAQEDLRGLEPARMAHKQCASPWWITSYSGLIAGAVMPAAGAQGTSSATAVDPNVESLLAEESATQAIAEEIVQEGLLASKTELRSSNDGGSSLHHFPKGAQSGVFLHGILEWIARQGFGSGLSSLDSVRTQIARRCQLRDLDSWVEPLVAWVACLLDTPLLLPDETTVALGQLKARQVQPELEFLFAANESKTEAIDALVQQHVLPGERRPVMRPQVLNGMLKGFIDLVFEHGGRYYVADYKSNWLGEDEGAYTQENMQKAMLEHRYDLQYVLYSLAVHRLLRVRLPGYDYDQHFGGALYLFLRGVGRDGQGIYASRPPRELIESLDALFSSTSPEASHAA